MKRIGEKQNGIVMSVNYAVLHEIAILNQFQLLRLPASMIRDKKLVQMECDFL